NTYSNGTARVKLNPLNQNDISTLLQNNLGSARANTILGSLFPPTPPRPGSTTRVPAAPPPTFPSPLAFYRKCHAPPISMTTDEFGKIANDITVTNGAYIDGRINVNTASATVLASLPGLDSNPELAQTLVTYRQSNPDKLGSIAWVVDALGENNSSVLTALQATDCITAQSYQISADVAALGPNGRGYHRVRFVFDTSDGTPKIIYRQDLTHLGWALGKEVRDTWLLAKATR